MICHACGVEAPTKSIEFNYNIGMLIVRIHRSMRGSFCKACIKKYFWECTLINLLAGWWGVISLFVTPVFIIQNISNYLGARALEPVPVGATPPQLTEEALRRLQPSDQDILGRLQRGESLEQVAQDIGPRVGVTPGQVALYVAALLRDTPTGLSPTASGEGVLMPAQPVPGPQGNWTCSVCGGYVRGDAANCKHCRASFIRPSDLPPLSMAIAPGTPHPVSGPRGSWTCSACGGYIRGDAISCKHCEVVFFAPAAARRE
jgi:hypothetical protein